MSKELAFSDGNVTLGNTLLPGLLVSQQINCAVKIDTAQVEGQAQKTQTPLEWDNAGIYLCLDLLTDDDSDCYDKLADLNRIFKGADNGRFAQIYRVNSRHARARGLDQVIFSGLSSDESDQDDVITVSLSFVEYLPPKAARKAAGIGAAGASGSPTAPAVTSASNTPAATAVLEDPNPFVAGFTQGAL